MHVDALARVAKAEVDAAVHQPLGVHALAQAELVHQVDRALLEHAGADAAQHVVAAALLDHHGVDAGLVQQLPEQQAGRAGADDGDLGAHGDVSGFDLNLPAG